jgi:hypothetical protein
VVREGIPISPRNEPVRFRFELVFGGWSMAGEIRTFILEHRDELKRK